MVDKKLKQIRKELLGMVKKDKRAEAEEILNRIIGELEPKDTVSDPSLFIGLMPESVQKKILKEVTKNLKKIGQYSEENVQRAMDSKLWDLDELIDYRKFVTKPKKEQSVRR